MVGNNQRMKKQIRFRNQQLWLILCELRGLQTRRTIAYWYTKRTSQILNGRNLDLKIRLRKLLYKYGP
jgi:hypothetical protein